MSKRPSRKKELPPTDAARKAGENYVLDQVQSTYFKDWVWDQMVEAEEMRQRDPNSVIPLESPSDFRKVARNMLQQLGHDIDRDLDPREVVGRDASREEQQEFWDGLHEKLRDPNLVSELVSEVMLVHEQVTKPEPQQELPGVRARENRVHRRYASEARAAAGMTPEQRAAVNAALQRYGASLTDDDRIAKGEKVLSVRVEVQKGRLRMVGPNDNLVASFPASRVDAGVADFVEKFWFWKPVTREAPLARRARPTVARRPTRPGRPR